MTATTSKLGADTMDQKTQMREGFEAQRKAGMNVDWFTWQIAWHDALFTVHDIAGDALARQPAAIDKQEARDAFDAWNDSQTALEFEDAEAENHARFIFTAGYIAAPVDTEASKPAAPMPAFNPLARMASGPELQERLRIISSKSMDAECSRLVDEEFFNLIDGAAPSVEQDEPRNVDGKTRAEFEQHLRVCLQHDNVRRKERGIPEMTVAAMEAEIKERVELNYPAKCPGCAAFDNPDALEVHFVQGCDGCKARMQKVAGFGPLCEARAASTSANVAQGAEAVLPAWFDAFLTNVCEIPDRNSPDDEPAAITSTLEELKSCALNAIEQCAPPAQTALTDDARDAIRRAALQDAHSAVRRCINVRDAEDAISALTAAQSASASEGK